MKKRFAVLALVFSLVLSLASTAFAYTVPSNTVVYVTPTGECYHLFNCSYIKNSYSSMTIADAEYSGYRACSRCDPDVMVGSYGSSSAYREPVYKGDSITSYKNEQAVSNNPVTNKLTGKNTTASSSGSQVKAEDTKPQAEETKSTSDYPWWVFFLVGIGADRIYLKIRNKEE